MRFLLLLLVFLLSLAARLPGIFTLGMNLNGPGTFQMVNYDETNSCEAALGWLPYPSFIGRQILTVASWLGEPPAADLATTPAAAATLERSDPQAYGRGSWRAQTYCRSRTLVLLQRGYSAVAGALTVALVGLLGLLMWPERPAIAWTACVVLGVSQFHVAESHFATVDAAQVFFIVLLTVVLTYVVATGRRWPLLISPFFLAGAVLAKWDVFAVLAYAGLLPQLRRTRDARRFSVFWVVGAVLVLCGLVIALWNRDQISSTISQRWYLLWGDESGRFGTDYGHIGTWRRWIRNLTNVPIVLIVGLGLPACLCIPYGVRRAWTTRAAWPLWAVQAPAFAYLLYMIVIGPVTYYRHYLPLLPIAALLSAYGLWESRWASRRAFLVLFFLYPFLLTLDSEYNYAHDPRHALRQWYTELGQPRFLFSYYVVPPPAPPGTIALFNMDAYLQNGTDYLDGADYVILSENWYDTAFPNELNGPLAWDPNWLIKTKPEYAVAYRKILSGQDPNLELETVFTLHHFTPEFLLHRCFYGTFQQFIGDLQIFRVKR